MKKNIFLFTLFSIVVLSPVKTVFNVDGMMCGYGCGNTINKTLKSIDGIDSYSVSYEDSKMEVVFDKSIVDVKTIINSLPNPYKATFLKENSIKKYAVDGITCMGCVNSIKNALKDKEGLEVYDIDYDNKILLLEFVSEIVSEEDILKLVPSKFKLSEILADSKTELVKEENNK